MSIRQPFDCSLYYVRRGVFYSGLHPLFYLRPNTFFLAVISVINVVKVFEPPWKHLQMIQV